MRVISGALKNYEWGSTDGLRPWTTGPAPLAELWFGVHPSGASPVLADRGQDDPVQPVLLDSLLTRAEVPILVKLLSAAKPLSVQVHPSAEFAYRGFHQINIAADPGNKPFADEFEKLELFHALTEFDAFVGWRDFAQVQAIFAVLSELTNVNFFPADATQAEAFAHLVRHHDEIPDVAAVIARIPTAVKNLDEYSTDAYRTVTCEFPLDPGCLLTLFLEVIHLEPGETIFIPSGTPHSYIRGTGIEVMTSSDNVLRLGLTSKPVFTDLALEALHYTSTTSEAPFTVRSTQRALAAETGRYRLVLALESSTTVELSESVVGVASETVSSLIIEPGQAVVITAGEPAVRISTTGTAAVITAENLEEQLIHNAK